MTAILNLPLVSFSSTIGTNESWTDAWAYTDASGNPISGAGITLNMMMRATAASTLAQIAASSAAGPLNGVALNGALSWGGTGNNVITLAVPRATMLTIAPGSYVAEVQAVADGYTKTIAEITVTVIQGIVR